MIIFNKTTVPYLTLSIDAYVQRVSLAPGAIYDCRGALSVEVITLCQAVQGTRLNTTWVTEYTQSPWLSVAQPTHKKQTR